MKYKITESKTYKNFIAVPVDSEYLDYGTIVFDDFKEADKRARELAKEKYPEIWGVGDV